MTSGEPTVERGVEGCIVQRLLGLVEGDLLQSPPGPSLVHFGNGKAPPVPQGLCPLQPKRSEFELDLGPTPRKHKGLRIELGEALTRYEVISFPRRQGSQHARNFEGKRHRLEGLDSTNEPVLGSAGAKRNAVDKRRPWHRLRLYARGLATASCEYREDRHRAYESIRTACTLAPSTGHHGLPVPRAFTAYARESSVTVRASREKGLTVSAGRQGISVMPAVVQLNHR
jgi:hypothetical protein